MKINRRELLHSAGALALTSAFGGAAYAQDYPSQDIRLICGFPAGSGADIFVRYFAEKLRPIAGRTTIVENKPGANSNVATEFVARSKPDGHVLYPFAGTTVAASMHLFKNPPVDVGKALKVAATTSNLAFMLVVDAKSPVQDRGGADRRDEAEGRQRQATRRRPIRAGSWARSTTIRRGSRRSKCSTAPRRIP